MGEDKIKRGAITKNRIPRGVREEIVWMVTNTAAWNRALFFDTLEDIGYWLEKNGFHLIEYLTIKAQVVYRPDKDAEEAE